MQGARRGLGAKAAGRAGSSLHSPISFRAWFGLEGHREPVKVLEQGSVWLDWCLRKMDVALDGRARTQLFPQHFAEGAARPCSMWPRLLCGPLRIQFTRVCRSKSLQRPAELNC